MAYRNLTNANFAPIAQTDANGVVTGILTNTLQANATVTAGNITTGNITTTNGMFWANGQNYSTSVQGLYGNSNVASYISTSPVTLSNVQLKLYEETVNSAGSASGTLTFDLANGSIQTITATGNITINTTSFTNMVKGSSIAIIITQGGSGNNILTSNLLYAYSLKTLSTAPGAIDAITVTYTGANYLATLTKGFA